MPFGAGHLPLILILLVVTLIIFGPSKLPELGSGMGKAIREFKKHTTELHTAVATAPVERAPIDGDTTSA
jgi:sec-independent protein translocase protein TatA